MRNAIWQMKIGYWYFGIDRRTGFYLFYYRTFSDGLTVSQDITLNYLKNKFCEIFRTKQAVSQPKVRYD